MLQSLDLKFSLFFTLLPILGQIRVHAIIVKEFLPDEDAPAIGLIIIIITISVRSAPDPLRIHVAVFDQVKDPTGFGTVPTMRQSGHLCRLRTPQFDAFLVDDEIERLEHFDFAEANRTVLPVDHLPISQQLDGNMI